MNKQNRRNVVQHIYKLSKQTGFTMIELMISIVLGLLVTAAALAIFLGAQRSANMQNGMGTLQQSAIFGLGQLTYQVRHANLDTTADQKITPVAEGAGIVFGVDNFPATATNMRAKKFTTENATSTVTNVQSDILTIQYLPNYYVERFTNGTASYWSNYFDCGGSKFQFQNKSDKAQYTSVQTFYIEQMPDSQQNTKKDRYALYCDASFYDKTTYGQNDRIGVDDNDLKGKVLSTRQMLIPDVDAFKVRLGIKDSSGNIRYMGVNDYKNNPNSGSVVSIELGILVRSADTVGADKHIDVTKTFNVAGYDMQLSNPDPTGPKYLREVFSQVVALRNAQGN